MSLSLKYVIFDFGTLLLTLFTGNLLYSFNSVLFSEVIFLIEETIDGLFTSMTLYILFKEQGEAFTKQPSQILVELFVEFDNTVYQPKIYPVGSFQTVR